MLKLLAVFCLVAVSYCDVGPPGSDSVDNSGAPPDSGDMIPGPPTDLDVPPFPIEVEEIVAPPMLVWIPEAEGTVQGLATIDEYSQCDDPWLYDSIDALLEVDMEDEYVCAFIAFQVHASIQVPYESQTDANERYALFKSCVDLVNEINGAQRSWTAEVNYFCDYTEAEKAMSRGFIMPEDEIKPDNDVLGGNFLGK